MATHMNSTGQRLSKEILVQYEAESRLMLALGFTLSPEVRERTPNVRNGTIACISWLYGHSVGSYTLARAFFISKSGYLAWRQLWLPWLHETAEF
jgi:hypothetical protein